MRADMGSLSKNILLLRSGLFLIFLILSIGFLSAPAAAQDDEIINLKQIPQRKVRKYIKSRAFDKIHDFSSLHSSWKKENNLSDFNFNKKIFYFKYKLGNVWECYIHANPVKTWNKQSVRFGLLISKYQNSITYRNTMNVPGIDTGQIFFLDLKILKGIFNIPVAFEVTNIDYGKQLIEFGYLENNKSLGKQTIQFTSNGDTGTRIIHCSYFKSGSALRDKILYPFFHKKFINSFHRNMKHQLKEIKPVAVLGQSF